MVETLGDHLRVKRLDERLRQKDLGALLSVSKEAIFLWENNKTTPPVKYLPVICEYLTYCPIQPVKNFGDQFKLWRTHTLGFTLKEATEKVGIYQKTLAQIEHKNTINRKRVFDLLITFLESNNFKLSEDHPHFMPSLKSGKSIPKFYSLTENPETLGQHLALVRSRKNHTKKQAAEYVGVSSDDVIRLWESEQTKPDARYYPKIMEYISYCPTQYVQTEAERLQLHRMHLGYSTRDVERILGLPKSSVYRIESKGQTRCGHIEKLWEFYKISC